MANIISTNFIRVFETYPSLLADTTPGGLAWVVDATADETVDEGSALYYWQKTRWVKKYEMEMMDRPTTMLHNFKTIIQFNELDDKLYFGDVQLARASDVEAIVQEVAPAIIVEAVDASVGQIVTMLVDSAMAGVVATLNNNITAATNTLRQEFAQADTTVLTTANSNIAAAKTEVLGAVVQTASNTDSISASLDTESRDLKMSLRVSTATGNRLSVDTAGAFVSKELPSDAVADDIAVFNGTAWVKMALSAIPSTLGWTTV